MFFKVSGNTTNQFLLHAILSEIKYDNIFLCIFFRDEAKLAASFKIKMTSVGEVYTLIVSGITVKMGGNYKCVATNKKGTAQHSAMITVSDGKPKPEEKKPEEKKAEEKKGEEKKPEEKTADEAKPKPKKGHEPPVFVETYSDIVSCLLKCVFIQ